MIMPELLLDLPQSCQQNASWKRFELPSVGLPAPAVLNITAIPPCCDAQNVSQFFR